MTAIIRELTRPGEVRALEPRLLEYFDIVCDALAGHGIDVAPEDPVAEMMARLDQFVPPKGRAFVAERGGATVGMAFLKPLGPAEMELKRLYVRSSERGTGLGRRLLRHTLETAQALGMEAVLLDTIRPLTAAIALYEAEGFTFVEAYDGSEIAGYAAVQPIAVYMKKAMI